MFELAKRCIEYENITTVERLKILVEKSGCVLSEFEKLSVSSIDPEKTLVAFIIGAVVSEDVIDEREYLMIYPALAKSFGYDFDFAAVKKTFYEETDVKKLIEKNRKNLMLLMSMMSEQTKSDIISLCLLILSVNGHLSLKKMCYVRYLCKA